MPIYEFLCPACNRVFSFLVKSTSERHEPTCPKCGGRDMRRRLSRFAVTGVQRKSCGRVGARAETAAAPADRGSDPLDNPQVEAEMTQLMADADGIDENDPRQLGRLMRRMTEITGEAVEPEMEEAMRRLEAGEDPEKIEADLGDVLGASEEADDGAGAPSYDGGLYDL